MSADKEAREVARTQNVIIFALQAQEIVRRAAGRYTAGYSSLQPEKAIAPELPAVRAIAPVKQGVLTGTQKLRCQLGIQGEIVAQVVVFDSRKSVNIIERDEVRFNVLVGK